MVHDEVLTPVEQEIADAFAAIDATNRAFPRYYFCWKTAHGSMTWVPVGGKVLPFQPSGDARR